EVFADEALTVQYELLVWAPPEDVVDTFTMNGVEYTYTIRPALAATGPAWCPYRSGSRASAGQAVRALFPTGAGAQAIVYDGAISTKLLSPTGTAVNCTSVTNGSYTPGSFVRQADILWQDSVANLSGGID